MPTANELLHPEVCDDILVVDLESRTIVIPKNVSVLGVEADDETRILHFHIPRYYCDVDLSEFVIRINYKNANNDSDMYIVTDKVIENDLIKFDWVVGRNAFTKKGNVKFSVCLKDLFEGVVKREFNTTPAILPVLEGLETGGAIAVEYADVFEQIYEDLSSGIQNDVDSYFVEHVNDFKGPKGDAFEYEDFTPEQLADLVGPKGDKGDKGQDGTVAFEDLTDEQREMLKGPQGEPGSPGDTGPQGVSGVYVGEGEMPEGYNVQVCPAGEVLSIETMIQEALPEVKLLPDITEGDNGKFLRVVNGAWAAEALTNVAEEGA